MLDQPAIIHFHEDQGSTRNALRIAQVECDHRGVRAEQGHLEILWLQLVIGRATGGGGPDRREYF